MTERPPSFTQATNLLELQPRIDEARKFTPRFLFRSWRGSSGGRPSLNQPDRITPLAFSHPTNHTQPSFFDLSIPKLQDLAHKHLTGKEDFETPFSSWSHSLCLVLDMFTTFHDDEAHLCILDTSKVDNIIIHTKPLGEILAGKDYNVWHEYLAYGPIRGEAFRAVPFSKIAERGGASLVQNLGEEYRDSDLPQRFTQARSIASLFGENFELPMVAHLITRVKSDSKNWKDTARKSEREMHYLPPRNWLEDPSMMKLGFYVLGYEEAANAMRILRFYVRARYQVREREEDDVGGGGCSREQRERRLRQLEHSTVSREAREMYEREERRGIEIEPRRERRGRRGSRCC